MTTTAPAPVATTPITVRIVVDVAAALRVGHTHAGEVALPVTPEWLAGLSPEEREVLAEHRGDLRHLDRPAGALQAREPSLDEARRLLAEHVAHAAARQAERDAEHARARAHDAAVDAAVEVARQTLAEHLAQWASAPVPAADMRAVLDHVRTAALRVGESGWRGIARLKEWDAVLDLIRARDAVEARAAGTAFVAELLVGAETGALVWDGRGATAYVVTVPVVSSTSALRHVAVHEDHRGGHAARALDNIITDEGHPLRERVLAVRAKSAAQVRAAIKAHADAIGAPELLAQYDAGRLSAERTRSIVALAAMDLVPVLERVGARMTRTAYPAIPRVDSGAMVPEAWRRWHEARNQAADATATTPWATVVAYPCHSTAVAVVALVGGHPYVARMDVRDECGCGDSECESCGG